MEISNQILDQLIHSLPDYYNTDDIKGMADILGIKHATFIGDGLTEQQVCSKFVDELRKRDMINELIYTIRNNQTYGRPKFKFNLNSSAIKPLNEKRAHKFGDLFTVLLKKLSEVEESKISSEMADIDSVDPVDFEDKMRKKAKLSPDIINQAIDIKPEISVLQRKAKILNYKDYYKLIRKVAWYYTTEICGQYPPEIVNSSDRYRKLYDDIMNMLPDDFEDEENDIETKVSGIIFDAVSKCLIFNE